MTNIRQIRRGRILLWNLQFQLTMLVLLFSHLSVVLLRSALSSLESLAKGSRIGPPYRPAISSPYFTARTLFTDEFQLSLPGFCRSSSYGRMKFDGYPR